MNHEAPLRERDQVPSGPTNWVYAGCGLVLACMLGAVLYMVIPVILQLDNPERNQQRCADHLKLIMQATRMYAAEHSDRFPPAEAWPSAVNPYLKTPTLLLCPDDRRRDRQGVGDLRTSYTMNLAGGGADANMAHTDWVALLWDGEVLSGSRESVVLRHETMGSRCATIGYADGHVRLCLPENLAKLTLTPPPAATHQEAP